MQKICSKCGKTKDISKFYKRSRNKDGYDGRCKDCCNEERTKYDLICSFCSKSYKNIDKNSKYCSKKCESLNKSKRIIVKCSYCGKQINIKPSRKKEHNFCNKKCQGNFISENIKGKNHHRYSKKVVYCSVCGKELIRHNCMVYEGRKYYCSDECKIKGNSKENSPRWNSNLTMEDRIIGRKYNEYSIWRKQVFERDNYTCQCCEDNKGHNLNAHHILNYYEYEELRTNLNNSITLCQNCHTNFHKIYGYKHNNKEQLEEFLNRYKNQAS